MTSSEQTAPPPSGAIDALAGRVGHGAPRATATAGACGWPWPARRVQRRASPGACSHGALAGLAELRGRPGRRHRGLGARAPSSCRWWPRASPPAGAVDAVICPGGGHPGRDRPLRLRGRRVRRRAPAGPARHRACRSSSACSPPTPSTRRWPARGPTEPTRATRRRSPRSRWSPAPRVRPAAGRPAGPSVLCHDLSDAPPGPAQGLARARHPGPVRRGRPGRCRGPRTSTTGRPSPTPGSTRCGSCDPRRSRSTWPTACSTWASPAGTGSRSGAPTWSRWASCTTPRPPPTRSGWCWPWPRTRRQDASADLAGQPGRGSATEYPELTRRAAGRPGGRGRDLPLLRRHRGQGARHRRRVVEITETGRALRAAGLRIVDTLLVSHTELIANPTAAADPGQAPRHGAAADPAAGHPGGPGEGAGQAQRLRRAGSTR